MAIILKKYSIPVITHTGTSKIDFYHTAIGAVADLVGTFSVSASLPTTAPTGKSLVGYRLKIGTTVVAHFKEGPLYSQTAVGYSNVSKPANVTTTMQQYENKIVMSGNNINTFYNGISNAIIEGYAIRFEAIYETIRINLDGVPTEGIKKVIFNGNDCDVFRIDKGSGYDYLFSKTSVTLKYVSKINFPTGGGIPTCTIQTVTGMNNVLMPNYKINKYVFPTSVQYSSTIDSVFEREETDEIYDWKDQVCLPSSSARSIVMTIPQKSRYIKSVNAYQVNVSESSGTSEVNLGEKKKMIEFDEAVLSEELGHRKFNTTSRYLQPHLIYTATYIRFNMILKNTADFSKNHGIVWAFTVRDMDVSIGLVVVKIKNGSTVIAEKNVTIQNNQTYSGVFTGIKGYSSIDFTAEPDGVIGSTTKLAFCPFYIKVY